MKLPCVTPYVGVWIETFDTSSALDGLDVTPYVGVWIETLPNLNSLQMVGSHTLRGCVD